MVMPGMTKYLRGKLHGNMKEMSRSMHNIEYLTERDLKYFEKKEALGEAIIIRIEPEKLLSMDLDELFRDRDRDQTLSAKELDKVLHADHEKAVVKGMLERLSEETALTALEKNLQHNSLSSDERQALMGLINNGASDEELKEMMETALRHNTAKTGEEHMDWRRELEKTAGVTDEGDAVDLTDMEGRELLDEQHLEYLKNTEVDEQKTDNG